MSFCVTLERIKIESAGYDEKCFKKKLRGFCRANKMFDHYIVEKMEETEEEGQQFEQVCLKIRTKGQLHSIFDVGKVIVWDFKVDKVEPIEAIPTAQERSKREREKDLANFASKEKKPRETQTMQCVIPHITVSHDTTKYMLLVINGTRCRGLTREFLECLVGTSPFVKYYMLLDVHVNGIKRKCHLVKCHNIVGAQLFFGAVTKGGRHEAMVDLKLIVHCVHKDQYEKIKEEKEFNK